MTEELARCDLCHRQLMDTGQCLYCTTAEALELQTIKSIGELETPPADGVIRLMDTSTGQVWRLDSPRVKIGRDPKNQIMIADDVYASRFHAYIVFEGGRYWVEDLGSKNGTLLNGSHILDREALSVGDRIIVGRTEFEVR